MPIVPGGYKSSSKSTGTLSQNTAQSASPYSDPTVQRAMPSISIRPDLFGKDLANLSGLPQFSEAHPQSPPSLPASDHQPIVGGQKLAGKTPLSRERAINLGVTGTLVSPNVHLLHFPHLMNIFLSHPFRPVQILRRQYHQTSPHLFVYHLFVYFCERPDLIF